MVTVGIVTMMCSGLVSVALAGPDGRSGADVPGPAGPAAAVVIAREAEAIARGWRLVRKRQTKMNLPVAVAPVVACTSRGPAVLPRPEAA